MIIFMKKPLILINNRGKIRLRRAPSPGDSLSGGQVSDGPLRGGQMAPKIHVNASQNRGKYTLTKSGFGG